MTGVRWSSWSLGDGEDTGGAGELLCSLLGDSAASQDNDYIAFAAALPLVQAIHISSVESSDQESYIQEVGAVRYQSTHVTDDLSEEVNDPRSGSCGLARCHFGIAMGPLQGNG